MKSGEFCRENEERLKHLLTIYGEVMSLKEIADLLKFNTVGALRKAHKSGGLGFELVKIKGRPGLFAETRKVSEFLTMSFCQQKTKQEV